MSRSSGSASCAQPVLEREHCQPVHRVEDRVVVRGEMRLQGRQHRGQLLFRLGEAPEILPHAGAVVARDQRVAMSLAERRGGARDQVIVELFSHLQLALVPAQLCQAAQRGQRVRMIRAVAPDAHVIGRQQVLLGLARTG